jgi:hypothetical protein
VIGYYVHHQGRGHLHRAVSIAAALAEVPGAPTVAGLSSLPKPAGWSGPWIHLDRDDASSTPIDSTASGRLHWVPEGDAGLRGRMAAIAGWIGEANPSLMVVDVSVEVALLARLLGVAVVPVALPGDRGDGPHTLGGISRFAVHEDDAGEPAGRRVVVLSGAGGNEPSAHLVEAAQADAAGWEFTVLGPQGTWVSDPRPLLLAADVVITHAGQNAIAEVAALRRPAIVIPQARPHDEQLATARTLATLPGIPALVLPEFPSSGWGDLLDRAAALDGEGWSVWVDGDGARRAAALLIAEASLRVPEMAPL